MPSISSSALATSLLMAHDTPDFSAYQGKQNNNTGGGAQLNNNNFHGTVNFVSVQSQGHPGPPEEGIQRAYESLEKRPGNQLPATPDYLHPTQSLGRQKMSSDAKTHSATALEDELPRFPLPPIPGPDHFIPLGPGFGESEERQGLLLNSHKLEIIVGQRVVLAFSNTQKRPPLVHEAAQYWFEKHQYRDTRKGLRYSGGTFTDEGRQSMRSAAHFSSISHESRMLALLETMPTDTSPKVQPANVYESEMQSITSPPQTSASIAPTTPSTTPASRHDEIYNHTLSPSPVGKHSVRGPGRVCEYEGGWKKQSKPAARASQCNSTQSPRQSDAPSTPGASVMNKRARKSTDNKVRQILMAAMLKPQRNPGTVCLTPAHPREGSYNIYYRGENAASSSKLCYPKQVPVLQIQCKNIIIIKRLVLAEFTDRTQTLECDICGHNHKDWIAALDADIKASVQAWAKLLETAIETSQVPKIGFSQDTHRWRKWASETSELRLLKGSCEEEKIKPTIKGRGR
ncbi:hypothetical protein ASPVEDRAFT_393802 [Aspergillus versicolor CBS 583.65]|uniref:Uncharacterized protein n=1 Tax=Aspergillus versicolor CBS 583.65 TaxID=1036611 RepID=A0A1L9Q3L0_ASPVE|nr:uncharacterized protein ASPVEDRAFT_393802 [Aspergillus versicolor CBS 583.65]OJJ08347.1 hypothetical protein ASPVEDRAFT_393802 [Aspergillus versicolor CBS 583.65]